MMSMLAAGRRNKRIVIEYMDAKQDAYGHLTVDPDWPQRGKIWAGISFGSGSKQREAAQLSGTQVATFFVLMSSTARATSIKDRIRYPLSGPHPERWPAWEIIAIADVENEGLAFTAKRVAL